MTQVHYRVWPTAARALSLWVLLVCSAMANSIPSLEKQAQLNNADAQYQLGLAFETGQGVQKDLTKASYWYQLASNNGHLGATYNYAQALEYGRGVKRNPSRAVLLYTKLAIQGDQSTYGKLAELYSNADVDIPATDQAVLWYSFAAGQSSSFEPAYEQALQRQFNQRQMRQIEALKEQESTVLSTPNLSTHSPNQTHQPETVGSSWATHLIYLLLLSLILAVFIYQAKRKPTSISQSPFSGSHSNDNLNHSNASNARLNDLITTQQRTIAQLQHKLKLAHQSADKAASSIHQSNTLESAYLRFGFSTSQQQNLTPNQLKSRYKQLSRIFHPDIHGSDEEMKQLNTALKTIMTHLKNSQKIH
ncbi:hypothetical protein BCU70_06710 [Vibrio sp. 10N.286.49.C2]|nr:hypothetical protein BCU70_06710 [Vibrio sp. 10N.286.49.C2]PMH50600.1 hypothetical protein BCU66_19070 [Vibrio sp. 10N.286.49.B1]PMH81464.1 hypothetical protein BCU58_21255 [Vibrio sp. 10N.286.48.B7]